MSSRSNFNCDERRKHMSEVLPGLQGVTPQWITAVLSARGLLTQGQVHTIYCSQQRIAIALVAHLELGYSTDASPGAPSRLVVKMTRPEEPSQRGSPPGKKEVAFYSALANGTAGLPVPSCYDAVYSAAEGRYHLLLEDLSLTHMLIPLPPTRFQCEQAIDCLARLHARWWDDPEVANALGTAWTAESTRVLCRWAETTFIAFADWVGDGLSPRRRTLYEHVLAALPALLERLTCGKHLTLGHGDAHLRNFLFPRTEERDSVSLLDWDSCGVAVGAVDLSYLLILHWRPEQRAMMEQPLLRRYHLRLREHGIMQYSWENLWHDYRWSIIVQHLLSPLQHWSLESWSRDLGRNFWWNQLERSFRAFEDGRCEELLKDDSSHGM